MDEFKQSGSYIGHRRTGSDSIRRASSRLTSYIDTARQHLRDNLQYYSPESREMRSDLSPNDNVYTALGVIGSADQRLIQILSHDLSTLKLLDGPIQENDFEYYSNLNNINDEVVAQLVNTDEIPATMTIDKLFDCRITANRREMLAMDYVSVINNMEPRVKAIVLDVRNTYNDKHMAEILLNMYNGGAISFLEMITFMPKEYEEMIPMIEKAKAVNSNLWAETFQEIGECCSEQDKEHTQAVLDALMHINDEKVKQIAESYGFKHSTARLVANFTLKDLLKYARVALPFGPKIMIANYLGYHKGEDNTFVTCCLLWLLTNTANVEIIDVIVATGIFSVKMENWTRCSKKMHTIIRSSQSLGSLSLNPLDLQNIMYLDVLYGRSGKVPDWEKERAEIFGKPVEKKLGYNHNTFQYDTKTWEENRDRTLLTLFGPIVSKLKQVKTMSEWYSTRYEGMAGGSASGVNSKVDLSEIFDVEGGIKANLNKKGYLELNDVLPELEEYLKGCPVNYVQAAGKPEEMGEKERALYASHLKDALLQSYIVSHVENILDERADLRALGIEALNRDIKIIHENSDGYKLMYDFDAFYRQHSGEDMEAIFQKIADLIDLKFGSCEYSKTMRWVGASLRNTMIKYPDKEEYMVINDVLMSGWRLTAFINTVLNICYIQNVNISVLQKYGYQPITYQRSSGDDVYMKVRDWSSAAQFLQAASDTRLKANFIKLLVTSDTGEFLRVTTVSDNFALGSLSRGLSTLVAGNWIGDVMHDPASKAQAISQQIALLVRRGMNPHFSVALTRILQRKWGCFDHSTSKKIGILMAASGAGKSTYVRKNKDYKGYKLVDGDMFFDWNKAASSGCTWAHSYGLLRPLLNEDKVIVLITPIELAAGMDRIPVAFWNLSGETLHNNKIQRGDNMTISGHELAALSYEHCKLRGFSVYNTIEECMDNIIESVEAKEKIRITIPEHYYYTSKLGNGLNLFDNKMPCQPLPEMPKVKTDYNLLKDGLPNHMTNDYIKKTNKSLHKKGLMIVREPELIKKLATDNFWSALPTYIRWRASSITTNQIITWACDAWDSAANKYLEYEDVDLDCANLVLKELYIHFKNGKPFKASPIQKYISAASKMKQLRGHIATLDGRKVEPPCDEAIPTYVKPDTEFWEKIVDVGGPGQKGLIFLPSTWAPGIDALVVDKLNACELSATEFLLLWENTKYEVIRSLVANPKFSGLLCY